MNFRKDIRIKKGKLPDVPGVYLMKDAAGKILYVGKAGNLKRRVSSYFQKAHDVRIEKLVSEIRRIDYEATGTAIEALIREAELIKKLEPPFNVREKDDKSFLYVAITQEKFPRVMLVRGKDKPTIGLRYGPFTSASSIREALKILRRIFPWSDHDTTNYKLPTTNLRPCFNYQLGLCPGTCIGAISAGEYATTIRNLKLFFGGKKSRVLAAFTREMRAASKNLEFEKAQALQRRIFALRHIEDVALIEENKVTGYRLQVAEQPIRIEGYDISNISGDSAVGSMVVFSSGGTNFRPDKNEYRKFRIRGGSGPDDTGMLREVFERRLKHREWRLPDLFLIDGGAPQVNAVKHVVRAFHLRIPVVGIAKGPERKRNDIIGLVPPGIDKKTLIQVRDEAHRFAVRYHRSGGPEALGLLLSVTGIGSLVGSLAIASMPNRGRGLAFLLSALVLGVALLAFSISTWLWVTALIMVVIGLGQAGRMSLSNILLMAYTQPSLQGRVMSVYMMEFSLVSFGIFLVGVLAEVVGVQWAIGTTAVSLIVISLAALAFVPRVRALP